MSALDVEALQQEISSDEPSGEDLEYDPDFGELERTAQFKDEQQIGDMVVEAEEPDWKEVKKQSLALLERSKDIRILMYLARSTLAIDGMDGFRDCLQLLRSLLENQWETVHPQLDEDDGDPTMRVNAMTALCDETATFRPLRLAPLVRSRALGNYGYRDLAIDSGDLPTPENGEYADSATLSGAFMDAESEDLQEIFTAVSESIEHVEAIDTYVTEQLGAGEAPSFSDLASLLKSMKTLMASRMSDAGVAADGEEAEAGEAGEGGEGTAAGRGPSLSGQINSRDDVIRALEKIIEYYDRNEPASPIPILMVRAKKLVPMGFIDIIKNVAPDGLTEVERLRGPEDEEEDDY